ncbi:transcriptional regulator BetI [Actinomadura rubteroloni]|uniref:Transcriptional regulator BetI n=1 Tax=Actinomadura rubteroloni TaxID=1926885 RepID=A0A2P4UEM5_9ACTN|nr:TetR family transcriptional regulator [Actinomadura rubteroloni]POM23486.1 transcriptional regulator BetI [Actinomadura rubteroloni]
MSADPRTAPRTRPAATRDALVEAAFALFVEQGFERTTVDEIAARAGIGRRSFFRYFPSKEDVVFPDHERSLDDLRAALDEPGAEDPVARACAATLVVARMYAAQPDRSLLRYRLTRQVPALRSRELTVVGRYERALAEYLRRSFGGRPDGRLRADVVAASAVAAHNNALRSWLRAGASGDAVAEVDRALDLVRTAWSTERGAGQAPEQDYVVLVARRGAPLPRVVRDLEAVLGERE